MHCRKTYHHGNLKEALVDATRSLIVERGPRAFTLAEAARQAGVSPAAPYRHFKGREDLLEEVARQGFDEFRDYLSAAYGDGAPNPIEAIWRIGQAYLAFANERPGSYIAMFESGLSFEPGTELTRAAERAKDVLVQASSQLVPAKGPKPPPLMIANHLWALSHGVVELFGRGRPISDSPFGPMEMLESAALIYLRGLGVIPFD